MGCDTGPTSTIFAAENGEKSGESGIVPILLEFPTPSAAGHNQATVSEDAEIHLSHLPGWSDSRGIRRHFSKLLYSNEPSRLLHHPLAVSGIP